MDGVFKQVGAFGLYQKGIVCIIGAMSALASMSEFASVFIVAKAKLICHPKGNSSGGPMNETFSCSIWRNLSVSIVDVTLNQSINNRASASPGLPFECAFDTTYYGSFFLIY